MPKGNMKQCNPYRVVIMAEEANSIGATDDFLQLICNFT
jgi:hypothetical protein